MNKARACFHVGARLLCLALIATTMVCSVAVVAAQESGTVRSADSPCLRARPYPECRVCFVTNSGAYARLGDGFTDGPRAILDAGAMINLSAKNAIGGSWFIAGEEDGLTTGPMLRWRRWLGPIQSIDVAVGTIVAGGESSRPGSVLGLVKYNPVHWFGVAARPELVRYREYVYDGTIYRQVSGTKTRLSLGGELSGKPGLLVGTGAVVVVAVLFAVAAASGGFFD